MQRFRWVGMVSLAVVLSPVCPDFSSAQVTLDPAWPENPRTFGGEDDDWARSVHQTTDGGYIVAGHTKSFGAGSSDVLLIKLDAQGSLDPAWDPNPKTFGGKQPHWARCVQQTTDGGLS